ncbi:Possible periplasmic protein [hydrothermal vent metagenome]|uniref:Possible periplasmic protein n=1 Tax=hydrothermal vent metagenome TaxID=652676 RepID=A0A1W1BL85_9ZZZZ
MKKLLLLLFIAIGLQAQIIDAIAIDVDGEPITTLEIQAVQEKLNMSKRAAIDALIKDRLEKGAIDRAHIDISPSEVDAKIEQIAGARGLSKAQMVSALEKKGLTWESYREQLALEMKKEQFFKRHIASLISQPSDDELKIYYETNRDKFSTTGSVSQMSLIVYASNSSKKLQEAMQNPMKRVDGVHQKSILASSNEMNPKLFSLINSTPEGSFTQPINTGRGFVAYYVKSKSSQAKSGFEMVKNSVMMQWMQEERVKAGRNFYNKLKNKANIRVIRL